MPEKTRRVFLTGASGFIGRAVLEALWHSDLESISCLVRHPASLGQFPKTGIQIVEGDLLNPLEYVSTLSTADTVVHLAAATGAARLGA